MTKTKTKKAPKKTKVENIVAEVATATASIDFSDEPTELKANTISVNFPGAFPGKPNFNFSAPENPTSCEPGAKACFCYTTPHGGSEYIPEDMITELRRKLGVDGYEAPEKTIERVQNQVNKIFQSGEAESYVDAIFILLEAGRSLDGALNL